MVTDRGRTIAQLSPPPSSVREDADLQELVDAGLIKLGNGRAWERLEKMPFPRDPNGSALKALLRDREEGR
jgi:hypothetical protein